MDLPSNLFKRTLLHRYGDILDLFQIPMESQRIMMFPHVNFALVVSQWSRKIQINYWAIYASTILKSTIMSVSNQRSPEVNVNKLECGLNWSYSYLVRRIQLVIKVVMYSNCLILILLYCKRYLVELQFYIICNTERNFSNITQLDINLQNFKTYMMCN